MSSKTLLEHPAGSLTPGDEFTIPAENVESLVARFGSRVRGMGWWNADGSLTLSRKVVAEALRSIGEADLFESGTPEPVGRFTEIMNEPSAQALVESLKEANKRRLYELMNEAQETTNPARAEWLKNEIIRAIFPE